jgi:hypothetical protein
MPVPKRWHPVSRDLNQDPEVWELTTRHGDRALRIWLEILAAADKTSNQIPLGGLWFSSLAQLTRMNLKTVVQVIVWMIDRGWIVVQGDQQAARIWFEPLQDLCRNWPKTRRKLAEDLPEIGRTLPGDSLHRRHILSLATCKYWKYRKRREASSAEDGSPPLLSVSALPNKKEKIAGSTSSSPANGIPRKRTMVMADEEFIAALKQNPAYAGIDIDREIGKLQAWLLTPKGKDKQMTRQRLVNWLNRIDTPLAPSRNGHYAQKNNVRTTQHCERIPL